MTLKDTKATNSSPLECGSSTNCWKRKEREKGNGVFDEHYQKSSKSKKNPHLNCEEIENVALPGCYVGSNRYLHASGNQQTRSQTVYRKIPCR